MALWALELVPLQPSTWALQKAHMQQLEALMGKGLAALMGKGPLSSHRRDTFSLPSAALPSRTT